MSHLAVADVVQQHFSAGPREAIVRQFALSVYPKGGHNYKYLAIDPDGTKWLVKVGKSTYHRSPEMCERELLVSLFGKVLAVPVVDAWIILTDWLQGLQIPDDPEAIKDRCVLMPWLAGSTVEEKRPAAAAWIATNTAATADILGLMWWMGDEDRGLTDVMLSDRRLILIDNGLCGPGLDPKLRGYHPTPEAYGREQIVKMCNSSKPSFVEFVLRDCELDHGLFATPNVLQRISEFDEGVIKEVTQAAKVSDYVAPILIDRKREVQSDYGSWFREASALCKWW